MEQDCDNWMQFRMTNCKIRMKKNVIPRANLNRIEACQEVEGSVEGHQQEDVVQSSARKKSKTKDKKSTSQEVPLLHVAHKSVQVNIKSNRDKGVQVELKTKMKSTGVNTTVIATSVATSPLKTPRKM